MRVGIVVREGPSNPAARVRAYQYVPRLASTGCTVRVLAWRATSSLAVATDSVRLFSLARWADVLVLQRPNQPPWVLNRMAEINPHVIVDFDDALWASALGGSSGAFGQRLEAAIAVAQVVTPGSEYLAAWVRATRPDAVIEVIRPSVDLDRYPVRHHDRNGAVVGWIGTKGNLVDFGDSLLDALTRLANEPRPGRGNVVLRTVSAGPLGNPRVPEQFVPWTDRDEAALIAQFDVGVMPLRDDERSRGRCGYKAIQYLAAGVPAAASPVGAGPEVVLDGATGVIVEDGDWHEKLGMLLDSPQLRAQLGQAGRDWVAENASLEANSIRWRRLLEQTAS